MSEPQYYDQEALLAASLATQQLVADLEAHLGQRHAAIGEAVAGAGKSTFLATQAIGHLRAMGARQIVAAPRYVSTTLIPAPFLSSAHATGSAT